MNRIAQSLTALFATLLFTAAAIAQDITGSIIDSLSKQALPQASVSLLQQDLVKATMATDQKGHFRFKDLAAGVYALKIEYVGYKTIQLTGIQAGTNHAVRLVLDQQNLKVVTVAAAKPYIVQKIDKTIVNVAGSPVATGGNAWEVLLRAPGVVEEGNRAKATSHALSMPVNRSPTAPIAMTTAPATILNWVWTTNSISAIASAY